MERRNQMRKITLLLSLYPILAFSQQYDSAAFYYSRFIEADTMSTYLNILASDEFEGRESGQRGQKLAAKYISKQFRINNVNPYKDSSYFQQFTLESNGEAVFYQDSNILVNNKEFISEKDYYLLQGVKMEQQITYKDILFLGYGIDDGPYNDYKNRNVRGKAILILDGEPISSKGNSYVTGNTSVSEWTTFYKKKIKLATENGASAIFIIDLNFEKNLIQYKSAFIKLKKGQPEIPVFYISTTMANFIFGKEAGIENARKKIEKSGKPVSKELNTILNITLTIKEEQITSENVIGVIEGSDLKDQVVVLSAHYDHLGKIGDIIYNGADDDGSGTSAILAMAKAFAKAKADGHGPRRTIVCIAFTGEEKGLLGSSYYVKHPVYPLENTICDLNIDMIGRIDDRYVDDPNYIYLIGSDKISSQLHTISENSNKIYSQLKLDYLYNDYKDKNRFYYRSDHYNFAKNGIPVIFYFNGVHADYHKETDDVEKIDFQKMEKITRLVFFTAWNVANQQERLTIDSLRNKN